MRCAHQVDRPFPLPIPSPGHAAVAAGLTALTMMTTACGGPASDEPATRLEKTTITVGMLPIADNVQLKVAIDRGFFKAEGLNVKYEIQLGGSDAVPRLNDGRLDLSFGAYVPFFQAHADGTSDLRIVADGSQSAPGTDVIVVPPKSRIRRAQDLAGKKIGVNVLRSFTQLLVEAAVEPSRVKLTSENFVAVPFPDVERAFRSETIDAALVPEPYSTLLQQTFGARVLLDACRGATNDFPLAGYAATAAWVGSHPKTLAAFQRAIMKAQRLLQDRSVIERALPTYTDVDRKTASVLSYPVFPTTLSATRLQRVVDFMTRHDLIRERFDVRPLMTPSAG